VIFDGPVDAQERVPVPPGVPACLQLVVVLCPAAVPDHAVDTGGAPDHPAAHPVINDPFLAKRFGGIRLRVMRARHREEEGLGHQDHGIAIGAARLDQQDLVLRVLRETIGQHAPCCAGPGDDVVVLHGLSFRRETSADRTRPPTGTLGDLEARAGRWSLTPGARRRSEAARARPVPSGRRVPPHLAHQELVADDLRM
jgi:hypothetical protein